KSAIKVRCITKSEHPPSLSRSTYGLSIFKMRNTDSLEDFRQRVLEGVHAYESRLVSELDTYRQQRAWRLMLACRKFYTLAFRAGWRGRWQALRWAAACMFRGLHALETAELEFPSLIGHLPEELFYPFPADSSCVRDSFPLAPVRQQDVIVLPVFNYDFRF